MAESDASVTTTANRVGDDPLLAWALASFHAAALLVVPLWLAHVVAPVAVGGLLDGLDTSVGLGLYLVLWGTTWYSNRRYLAASAVGTAKTLKAGATWGAVTGLPLLVGVVLVVLVATNPMFATLLLVAGTLAAPLVGAVVGVVFAGVDIVLVRLAGRLAS